jgi:hypothetical protein
MEAGLGLQAGADAHFKMTNDKDRSSGSLDPSASSPRPLATQATPAARRALLASALGWLFDDYETYTLFLVGAVATRDLIAPDQLTRLPLYFGGLAA